MKRFPFSGGTVVTRIVCAVSLLLALLPFQLMAQSTTKGQSDHAKWTISYQESATPGEGEIIFSAAVDAHWHIFALKASDGDGPISMEFTLNPSGKYSKVGKVIEKTPTKKYDESFETNIYYFEGTAVWKQKIKVNTDKDFTLAGKIYGQTCTEGQCTQVDLDFTVPVKGCPSCKSTPASNDTAKSDTASGTGMNGGGNINQAELDQLIRKAVAEATQKKGGHPVVDTVGCKTKLDRPLSTALEPGCGDDAKGTVDNSILGIFLAGFLGGLVALLTPCVFPMIPMTVSFFTKRSKDRQTGLRNAFIYAVSIIVIYVSLGMLITIIFGSDALNDMASNVYFNMLFFIVFIVFAMSFFGAFEIVLPSSFVNKVDRQSDRGGLIGIFFMAFTLSLVSFSCTGPIIGTLLVEAARGGSYFGPAVGMFGFSLALALPFALFAMFPGWLSSLPKSGGWLNTVKVTLGFVELALALKFLSTVDLAYHWGFLKRELFLALWIIIAILLGLYLLGKLKFAHDSDSPHISTPRLMFGLLSFAFGLYLLPGIFGAPVNFVTGYLPPSYYKEWRDPNSTDCPNDMSCFHNLNEAMCYAKKEHKPLMIDFTGYACVNCRKMEDNVWPDPEIYKIINDKYVLASLYVDDKAALPLNMQYKDSTGRLVNTWGKHWSTIQRDKFRTNSQPWYVLIDADGKLLAKPQGYTPNVGEYKKYLETGLCRYDIRNPKESASEEKK